MAKAFTLIELLVVIATLTLLSALLLPAMCRATSATKVANCLDNYRQWAVSVMPDTGGPTASAECRAS